MLKIKLNIYRGDITLQEFQRAQNQNTLIAGYLSALETIKEKDKQIALLQAQLKVANKDLKQEVELEEQKEMSEMPISLNGHGGMHAPVRDVPIKVIRPESRKAGEALKQVRPSRMLNKLNIKKSSEKQQNGQLNDKLNNLQAGDLAPVKEEPSKQQTKRDEYVPSFPSFAEKRRLINENKKNEEQSNTKYSSIKPLNLENTTNHKEEPEEVNKISGQEVFNSDKTRRLKDRIIKKRTNEEGQKEALKPIKKPTTPHRPFEKATEKVEKKQPVLAISDAPPLDLNRPRKPLPRPTLATETRMANQFGGVKGVLPNNMNQEYANRTQKPIQRLRLNPFKGKGG